MSNHNTPAQNDLMPFGIAEIDRRQSIRRKATAIIATNAAPLPMLAWCLCSLFLRSCRGGILEKVIVVIGGPNDDTGLQDSKQRFVDDLRKAGFPLEFHRVWGPTNYGHSEAIDSAVPWVRTQAYLLMHDDAILLSRDWEQTAREVLDSDNIAMAATPGVFPYNGISPAALVLGLYIQNRPDGRDGLYIGFPHVNTVFTLCRKDLLSSIPGRWTGCNVLAADGESFASEEQLKQLIDVHKSRTIVHGESITGVATWLSMDIGAFLYAGCVKAGFEFAEFPSSTVKHFTSMSWRTDKEASLAIAWESPEVAELEAELSGSPELCEVYGRHVKREAITSEGIEPSASLTA